MDFKPIRILKRCKSECDLSGVCDRQSRRSSESSNEVFGVRYSGSDSEDEMRDHVVDALEMKIDRLSDLFLEQCRLLTEVKEEIRDSKTLLEKSEILKKTLGESAPSLNELDVTSESRNWRARSLLDAIETKRAFNLERELLEALTEFLQSNELKEQIVSSVVDGLRDMIRDHFSADMSGIYLPLQQRAYRRLQRTLTRTLEDGFAELEANSASLTHSLCRATRSLRRSLDRHQRALQAGGHQDRFSFLASIVEDLLQTELREWRHLMVESVRPADDVTMWAEREPPPPQEYPASPQQPPRPGYSIIDQLMTTAEINKQIQDGDVNGAFSRALSAADLSLVMSACRAVDPAVLFSRRYRSQLSQSVLLSLAQQLPTDMVHDTQLKCRYLEETLINLDPLDPVTRTHLPLVVGEIHKYLTAFLANYPSHVAHKRIMLIVMAANNLLK